MMRGTKYSTLHQDDHQQQQQQQHQQQHQQQEDEEKQRKADRMERINVKATAFAWVVVAALVAYYSDIVSISISDKKVKRWAFNIAVVSFVSNFCIMIYVTVWVPEVLKNPLPMEKHSPTLINYSTGISILCILMLIIAFWPVYGLLTPLLIFILLLGFLFSFHFIPWF